MGSTLLSGGFFRSRRFFHLELTWFLSPFLQNSFRWEYNPRSSLCTHAFHCTDSKDPDIYVLDWWMPATKNTQHAPSIDRRPCCALQPIRAFDSGTPPASILGTIFEDRLCSHDWVISTWSSREMEGGLWLLKRSGRNVQCFVQRLCSSHPSQLSRHRTLQSNQVRSDLPLQLGYEWSRWIVWAGRSKTAGLSDTIKLRGVGGGREGGAHNETEEYVDSQRDTHTQHTHKTHTHNTHTHTTHVHNTQTHTQPHTQHNHTHTTTTQNHTHTQHNHKQPHTHNTQPHTQPHTHNHTHSHHNTTHTTTHTATTQNHTTHTTTYTTTHTNHTHTTQHTRNHTHTATTQNHTQHTQPHTQHKTTHTQPHTHNHNTHTTTYTHTTTHTQPHTHNHTHTTTHSQPHTHNHIHNPHQTHTTIHTTTHTQPHT